MKLKITITLLSILTLWQVATYAQEIKIGYANVDLVVAYMEETKAMQQEIKTFEDKLAENIRIKQEYARTKYGEYQSKVESGNTDEATLKPLEDELKKLDQEIQAATADAQQKALAKRNEKMSPITEKVATALETLANEEGYTLVLNSTDGSGTSIVLYAPEEHNLTEKLATKLGVKFPEAGSEPQAQN